MMCALDFFPRHLRFSIALFRQLRALQQLISDALKSRDDNDEPILARFVENDFCNITERAQAWPATSRQI